MKTILNEAHREREEIKHTPCELGTTYIYKFQKFLKFEEIMDQIFSIFLKTKRLPHTTANTKTNRNNKQEA